MKRALLVSPSSVPGGAERALVGLARRLPAHGWEVEAVLLQPGALEGWLADAGCGTVVIDAGRTRQLHRTAATVAQLARLARGADVVVSNQSKGHVYGGAAALAARRPAVWWQHGTPEPSRIESVAARVPAAVVVAGSGDAVAAQRRLTPRSRVELVHPGVDTAAIARRAGSGAAVREQLGWQACPVVSIVGRLQEWKGQEVFLRAAAQVAARHPETVFAVVGGALLGWEGDYPQRLGRLADELGIADRVHFAGHQDDVYPWFDASDVVVHASFGEPFGLVLVEAMALGKPLVATAAGGPTEIILDGESGLLVPPGDADSMAAAISGILAEDELRARLGVGATARAARFDERAMTANFAALLDDLAGEVTAEPPSPIEMAGELTHDTVAAILDPPGNGIVLDAGAGAGAFTRRLRKRGFTAIAAGIRTDQYTGQSPLVVCNLDDPLPFGDATVQGIVAIELIEHLEAPLSFVREAARCLKHDGWMVITTPNVLSAASKLSFIIRDVPIYFGDHEYETNGHISPVSNIDLNRIAARSGLQIEHICYSVGKLPIPKLRHWIPLRNPKFRNKTFGESLIVKMRKMTPPAANIVRG